MGTRRPTDYRYRDGRRASWEAIRRHVLASANHLCVMCGDEATEVDHIWPRYYGGDDRSDNLQALCRSCNRAKGNTVDLDEAEVWQLEVAAQSCLDRALAALDEFDRFATPLFVKAEGMGSREAAGALRRTLIPLQVLAGDSRHHVNVLGERLAAPRSGAEAADTAVLSIFEEFLG